MLCLIPRRAGSATAAAAAALSCASAQVATLRQISPVISPDPFGILCAGIDPA